jgi:hypothetical protein
MPGPLRAEVRHSLMLTAVPVLAFLGGLAGWLGLDPGVATWDATSLAILSATQLLGPVAAGLACWIAQREQRRQLVYLRVLSARRAPAVPLYQLAAAVLWVVVAYLAVCGALVLYTVVHDGVGPFSAGAVVAGCLGAAVHVAVGYLVGAVVRWRLAAPVVALGCYVAVVLNMDHAGQWFYLLSPVTVEISSVFVTWQRGVFAAQGWWLLAVLVVITALVSMTGRTRPVAVATALVALLAAVFAAQGVAAYGGHLFADRVVAIPRVCEGSAPAVCVHPAFRAGAGPIRQEFAPLVRRLAGTPARITVLQHRAAWDRSPLPPGVAPLYLDDLAPGFAVNARESFVRHLTTTAECDIWPRPRASWYSDVVDDWLLDRRPGFSWDDGGAQMRLARATESQRHTWFVAHFTAYRTCALTASSFASLA